MNHSDSSLQAKQLVDQAAKAAGQALASTQQMAHDAVNGAAHSMAQIGQQADALAQRGADSFRRSSQQIRDGARQAGDSTVAYIREEPVKSVLIAAAAGAALTMLVRLMARGRG